MPELHIEVNIIQTAKKPGSEFKQKEKSRSMKALGKTGSDMVKVMKYLKAVILTKETSLMVRFMDKENTNGQMVRCMKELGN
jgi:hypothetical protein